MKKLLLAAALAVLFASPSLAQDQGRDRRGGPEGPRTGQPARPPSAGPAQGQASPQNFNRDRARQDFNRGAAGAGSMAGPRPGGGMAGPPAGARPGPQPGTNFAGPRPGFQGPRPGGRQDFSSLRRSFNAPQRYRAPVYRRPPGFYVHRWRFGEILPSFFWAQNYWLSDYFNFGLMPPPPGTIWVRYGSDALLIDRFSGEIIQVAYNVFY